MRTAGTVAVVLACGLSTPAWAQQAGLSRIALDSVVSTDGALDGSAGTRGMIVDAVGSASLGGGFEAVVRPFVQRMTTGEWNRQVWVAMVKFERSGPVGVRVEAGLIPSPVGLANITLRPQLNPAVSQPSSLFTSLPAAEARAPRTVLLGALYPYGVSGTLSGRRWDARLAVIDTSPLRSRRVFARTNPPRFTTVVAGAGFTPRVGVHVGGSLTAGGWLRTGETPSATADRNAVVATLEADVSFGHTHLSGEYVRDRIETVSGATRTAAGWYTLGEQRLTPRWFAAGRIERMASPALVAGSLDAAAFAGTEAVVGFRLTPEVTLRAGHRARRAFLQDDTQHAAIASLVWWRRWR